MTEATGNAPNVYREIADHIDRWMPTFRELGSHDEIIDAIRAYAEEAAR